ncbi:unnamed protein product [Paramecium primaurelia]|uniref:MIR domain-containing protein n=1 Tax=Paramecium primaurelia TaxID=5886 RepID=A0A8S1MMU7_PARPR|nr:unnamed protein product [Paramecium primaurelia]
MEQNDQLPFKTFQLLQIQCQLSKKFLSGNIQLKQKYIGKDFEITSLSLQINGNDPDTHFIIELQNDTENKFLYYGDLIAIKHFKTQLYINVNHDQRSDHQKEADVCLMEQPEYFVIQPPEQDNTLLLKYLNKTITHPFRLLSSDNRKYLISQLQKNDNTFQIKSKQKFNANNETEGVWNFVYINSTNNILKMFNRVYNLPIYVESGRKVIIRNLWTGFTLHSHNNITQLRKAQEVTCFSHPRDDNDYWSIVKQQSRNTSKYINCDDQIFLQHLKTALYLNGSDQESYSKLGQLVFCSDEPQLFYTQSFDDFILEMNKPFTIKFNNYFLAQSSSAAESKIGIQQEYLKLFMDYRKK